MSLKKLFPPEEGWITADLTLTSSLRLTDDQLKSIKHFLSGGNLDTHEFGYEDQRGMRLRIISRKKPQASEVASWMRACIRCGCVRFQFRAPNGRLFAGQYHPDPREAYCNALAQVARHFTELPL